MATVYNWVVSAMDTIPSEDGLTDVVSVVHWRRQATDGQYFADVYSTLACAAPDPMSFTPYADLTFEQVCGWLEANLDVASLDAGLDQQIENEINPPIVQLPLPWQQQPAQVVESPLEESIIQSDPS